MSPAIRLQSRGSKWWDRTSMARNEITRSTFGRKEFPVNRGVSDIDGEIETQEVNFRWTGRVVVENAEIETQEMFRIVLLFWKFIFFFETKCYTYRDGNEIGIVKLNYTVFSANFGFFFFLRYIAMSRDIYRRWRNWNIGNISKRFEYFFFFLKTLKIIF